MQRVEEYGCERFVTHTFTFTTGFLAVVSVGLVLLLLLFLLRRWI